jgi:hypothetical protein
VTPPDELLAGELAPVELPWHRSDRNHCFGCARNNAGALRVGHAGRAVAWLSERPAEPGQLYKARGEIRDDRGTARGSYQWMTAQSYGKYPADCEHTALELARRLRDDAA